MTQPASVRVSTYVAVDPELAFKIFTEEIDAWYQRGPHAFQNPRKAVGVRFEPGVGGQLLEVHDDGSGRTMGTVTAWEPGRRLAFTDRRGTEVEVTFDRVGTETRVTLEHRGLERLRPELADRVSRNSWRLLIPWFEQHLRERTT